MKASLLQLQGKRIPLLFNDRHEHETPAIMHLRINSISSRRLESSIQKPISQISENESFDSRFNGSEVSVENKTKPIKEPEFVNDPGGLETSIQEPYFAD